MSDFKECPECTGDGECHFCAGKGWRYVTFNARAKRETCANCIGVGVCARCNGQGIVRGTYDDAYVL